MPTKTHLTALLAILLLASTSTAHSAERLGEWQQRLSGERFSVLNDFVMIDSNGCLLSAHNRRLFTTTDGGLSWQEEKPFQQQTGYSSCHPWQLNGNQFIVSSGAGLAEKRLNGSWQPVHSEGLAGGFVGTMTIPDYRLPHIIAHYRHNAPNSESGGLIRSVDGGRSWSRVLEAGIPGLMIRVSPSNPAVLYGRTSQLDQFGFYRSTDSGQSWQRVRSLGHLNDFAIDSRDSRVIYAITRVGANIALISSTDGGHTWYIVPVPVPAWDWGRVHARPSAPGVFYLCTTAGVWRGTPGGRWDRPGDLPTHATCTGIASSGDRLVASLQGPFWDHGPGGNQPLPTDPYEGIYTWEDTEAASIAVSWFDWTPAAPRSGEAVQLVGQPADADEWIWHFPDGTSESGRVVIHQFDTPGDHRVVLEIRRGDETARAARSVNVPSSRTRGARR
jgi:hypothetical protein